MGLANDAQFLSQKHLIRELKPEKPNNDNALIIKSLIEIKIIHLKNEINFGSLFSDTKAKTKERDLLLKIKFDGSPESVSRLLYAYETVSSSTAYELNPCLAILPPKILLNASLLRLDKIANNLEKERFSKNAEKLRNLVNDLKRNIQQFEEKKITHECFVQNCSELIDGSKKLLSKHCDYSRVFNNIALAIVGLGAFYLVAGIINKALTGNFLFFNGTKLSRISNDIKHIASSGSLNEDSTHAVEKVLTI